MMHMVRGVGETMDGLAWKHTHHLRETDTLWESAACLRELRTGLWNKLVAGDQVGDRREAQEGGDIRIPMVIHVLMYGRNQHSTVKQSLFN